MRDTRLQQARTDRDEAVTRLRQAGACLDDWRTRAADILEDPPDSWEIRAYLDEMAAHINCAIRLQQQMDTHVAFATDALTNLTRCPRVIEALGRCSLDRGHSGRCQEAS